MGFTEILTVTFIVLKLCGIITWSWGLVLLPEIIAATLYLLCVLCVITSVASLPTITKAIEKQTKKLK